MPSSPVGFRRRLRAMWLRRALACLAAGGVMAPSTALAEPFERLADWIRTELEGEETPSLAVAVARDGRVLWAEGFGYADRERRVPATPHTRYSLASVSKPLTATGLMALVERGLVDLDRPVNDYLTEARLEIRAGSGPEATVRRVASHAAGLPIHHHFFVEGQRSPPAMEETIRRYGQVMTAPGERFRYSNLGYGVLGYVLGRLTGRSYRQFMHDEVFRPLGMHRTSVGIPPGERDDYAIRYARNGAPLAYYAFDHDGASAVFSSAADLAAFGLIHVGRPLPGTSPLLSDASIRLMQRPWADDGVGGAYGIGWQIRDLRRGRIVSHGGGMPGVTTSLTLVPSARLVIVALANASSSLPALVTERILAELAPAYTGPPVARSPARRVSPSFRPKPGRRLVGTFSGYVHGGGHEMPLRLRIEQGGAVFAGIDGNAEARLASAGFDGNDMRGLLRGVRLPTDDASSAEVLSFALTRRGDALSGSLTALASSDDAIGFALSHWVNLRREAARR